MSSSSALDQRVLRPPSTRLPRDSMRWLSRRALLEDKRARARESRTTLDFQPGFRVESWPDAPTPKHMSRPRYGSSPAPRSCPPNYSARVRWTNETAIDPSPTADATRLTLPHRTSPTANTPGSEVSSRDLVSQLSERKLNTKKHTAHSDSAVELTCFRCVRCFVCEPNMPRPETDEFLTELQH